MTLLQGNRIFWLPAAGDFETALGAAMIDKFAIEKGTPAGMVGSALRMPLSGCSAVRGQVPKVLGGRALH